VNRRSVVIITTPSLDVRQNVSGIATVVRVLMQAIGSDEQLRSKWSIRTHPVGKIDAKRRGIVWLTMQLTVPIRFALELVKVRPSMVHINTPLNPLSVPRDVLLVIIARALGVRVLLHVHGGAFLFRKPISKLMIYTAQTLLRLSSCMAVLTEKERASICGLYGVDSGKVHVLTNAVDIATVPRSRPDDNLRINLVSMGRLCDEKGLRVLCAAFEHSGQIETAELKMFGAGPLETEATNRLTEALGARFYFGGVADAEQRSAAFEWADILLLPSIRGEGLPMVLLEAMAAGVVPIATDDGSVGEVVSDGQNGFLIPKNDHVALSIMVSKVYNMKLSGELSLMSGLCQKLIASRYSSESYGKKVDKLYESIIK